MTAIEYFKGDELAASVWENKYAMKNKEGDLLETTPEDMHHRLAKEFARIENKYPNPMSEEMIFSLLKDFKYIIPQGSPMFGIGNNNHITSISNCFVIGNKHDSYGGIMETDQEQIQLMKRRGGVGHDLSHIRPKGSSVNNSAITSTGVVPFMERYSNSTREVAQDGRRGALMLTLKFSHPDAEDFVDAKLDSTKVTGANVSMKVSDKDMHGALSGIGRDGKLWDKIIHNAWKSAEPGVLFWDTILKESIPSCYGDEWKEISTNPCGEVPLNPYDSCRLMAINLYSYVGNPFQGDSFFDWAMFEAHAIIAQRLMDDMVDLEIEKIDKILAKIWSDEEPMDIKVVEIDLWNKIRDKAVEGRRTGLGITGEADMLAALGITYGSSTGNDMTEDVHSRLKRMAYLSSMTMAKERGAFPIWDGEKEKDNPFLLRFLDKPQPRRNIALLTIAPTGTTSLMAQVSSGIEPVFSVFHKRRKKINPNENDKADFIDQNGDHWKEYNVLHHNFVTWYMHQPPKGLNGEEYLTFEECKKYLEGVDDKYLEYLIAQSPYYKATANEIDWLSKVEMQGAVQKHVDHSISVTHNLPESATEDDVRALYEAAYKNGCKGVTVYREGSRSGVLVSSNESSPIKDNNAPKRPKSLPADVIEFQNNKEKWVAFVGLLHGRPYEIFLGKMSDKLKGFPRTKKDVSIVKEKTEKGKVYYAIYNGTKIAISSTFKKSYWNYAKFISGHLRHGIPLQYIREMIKSMNMDDDSLNSWKAGVARIITKYISDGVKSKATCPNCGAEGSMVFIEGCETCQQCGTGACG